MAFNCYLSIHQYEQKINKKLCCFSLLLSIPVYPKQNWKCMPLVLVPQSLKIIVLHIWDREIFLNHPDQFKAITAFLLTGKQRSSTKKTFGNVIRNEGECGMKIEKGIIRPGIQADPRNYSN